MTAARTERRGQGAQPKVLVVDDEADIRELLDLTLARMGILADCAASVGEAARRGSLEPGKAADVVLVDGRNLEHLVYHYGVNTVTDVVVSGRPVVRDGRRVPGT